MEYKNYMPEVCDKEYQGESCGSPYLAMCGVCHKKAQEAGVEPSRLSGLVEDGDND